MVDFNELTLGFGATFIFLYMLFTKFFPIVSIWEIREVRECAVPEVVALKLRCDAPALLKRACAQIWTPRFASGDPGQKVRGIIKEEPLRPESVVSVCDL